ncbi:ArsR family transcriptional regulator [Herbaspirillum sp. 3R11]|nr:ArsR family transcriptional regulator [Herbaspirillum sp. 3R-3a1]TFI09171.1 ArsR family transcriptional regulator [Herbaspirillum sp. 3R11]TFI15587.1 ArsR family transcriptional regulator [Herbaspirillum sp. 3R-11]TFI31856.1 ArsR family transcriptional regulator [Herbaspirillum sp. 3C11]
MNEDATMFALSAIAHRSRLAIFKALAAAGPRGLSAGEISGQLKIVPSSLSFHLKEMSRAALLSARREGTYIYYSAEEEVMAEVIDFLIDNCLAEGMPRRPE